MLHTTFVDVCMHVHVSCHPASHQLLMRPAGSLLGPNQTGDSTDLALSALYTPLPRSPTPTLPCPPDILENHERLSMRDRFGNGQSVCIKSSASSLSCCQGPESKGPKSLQLQTCLSGYPLLHCFTHPTTGAVKLRSGVEKWKGGNTLRHSHGNIVTDYGNRNMASVTYGIPRVTTITMQTDKTDPIQHVIMCENEINCNGFNFNFNVHYVSPDFF